MRTSAPEIDSRATSAHVEGRRLVVELADGRSIAVPMGWFPRLERASLDDLSNWRLIGGGVGIHWPTLDEDLSIAGMLRSASVPASIESREQVREVLARVAYRPVAAPAIQSDSPTRPKDLQAAALSLIESEVGHVERVPGTRAIYIAGEARLNLRTATEKRTDAYWFDVTPAYYEYRLVDFFTYVCGSPENTFVFSREEMSEFAAQSNRGGAKQVPNFTLHVSTREFEPAGAGGRRISIERQWNAFERIRHFRSAA